MPVRWMTCDRFNVGTYCILHFTSFSIGMGFKSVRRYPPQSDTASAHLVNLLGLEGILKDLEVGNELILVLGVHLNSQHLHVA